MPDLSDGVKAIRLDREGRITIPKAMRDELGWKPGLRIEWTVDAGVATLAVVPATATHLATKDRQ